MSSDRLSSVQKPVVAVDFDVKNNEGSSTVSMEMNKEELSSLITSLEAANRVRFDKNLRCTHRSQT